VTVTEEHWAAIERHFDALFERSPAERSAGRAAIADEQIRCEVASLRQHSGSGGMQLLAEGKAVRDIARTFKVHEATIYRLAAVS
jgi:hypothetical protein